MKAVIYMRVGNLDQLDDRPSAQALRRPPKDMSRDNADNDTCTVLPMLLTESRPSDPASA